MDGIRWHAASALETARLVSLAAAAAKLLRAQSAATYALYSSEQARAWVGAGTPLHAVDQDRFFTRLGQLPGPFFFLIGPPRGHSGSSAASALAIEPRLEVTIDSGGVEQTVGEGGELLAELRRQHVACAERGPAVQGAALAAPHMSGWGGDTDEQYRTRLARAIELTRGKRGKIIVTRRYERTAPARSATALLEQLGFLEPNAAAIHYAEIADQWVSLGTSPENVIESHAGRLLVDAVAGTRPRAMDDARDAELYDELLSDAKERREHAMAVERAERFAASVCAPGSEGIAFSRRVRRLRAVQHLHSRAFGTLEPDVRFAALMQRCHPPLASYPEEFARQVEPPWPGRFYGGMLGRITGPQDGLCFLNLRCVELERGSVFTYGGVGVVDGSSVEAELHEVLAKLLTVRDAVERWLVETA